LQQQLAAVVRVLLHHPRRGAADPDIALGVEVTRVQARIDHVQVTPEMDDVPSGIEFDERRSEARRVQIALIDVLAIQNQHVIVGVHADAAEPPKRPLVGQRLRPGEIGLVPHGALLSADGGRERERRRRDEQQSNLHSHRSVPFSSL
jgi:hypothetical protein